MLFDFKKFREFQRLLLKATKVTARIPATAKVASKPGVVVVVVDLVVVVGSVAGVELVVVVVDLASVPGAELVTVVVDLVASEPGVVLVVATVVDLVASSAILNAISIIMAMSMVTNIFFILRPHSIIISGTRILNSKLCKL